MQPDYARMAWMSLLVFTIGSTNLQAAASNDLAHAVSLAPAVTAARLRFEAALTRQGSSGRLADPTLEGMVAEKQTPTEDNPMWGIALQQPLPKAGERKADRQRAVAVADMTRAEWAMVAGDTAADVAMQLAEAETARRREALIHAQRERLTRVLTAIDARVATGQSRSAERLTLQSRLADMQLMAEREMLMVHHAESAARARLGLAESAPLPAYAAPEPASLDPKHSPAVQLAEARAREAAAMTAMARASRLPMTALGVRFEREELSDGNEDTVGVAFMTELPWRSRGYARADGAAAMAEEQAGRADAEFERLSLTSLVAQADRAEQLAATARRLAEENAARLSAQYDAMLQNAGISEMANGMSVLMLVDILEQHAAVELQVIEAEGAARIARAALWPHAPETAFAFAENTP